MRLILIAALFGATLSAAQAQAPAPAPPKLKADSPECLENPFRADCPPITLTPGAQGPGLRQGTEPGIVINGLRPMDRPALDRDTLRLPQGTIARQPTQ